MMTKRQVLKAIIKTGNCRAIECYECPYHEQPKGCVASLRKIGAMAILRQNRKKREFDPNKVLTCVTAYKAEVGMNGYFADNLASLRGEFIQKNVQTLTRTFSEGVCARFEANNYISYILFYPIDDVEE